MHKKEDIAKRRARLTPEQRDLLEKRLRGEQAAEAKKEPGLPSRIRRETPVVAIQPAGSKLPLFCVHPSNGSVVCYLDLARHLGSDQPLYGLQSPGLESEGRSLNSIEEMAAHYVAAMMEVEPRGPYLLAGWSMGGIVAYEMAQQLFADGCDVRLLALIDVMPRVSESQAAGEGSYNYSAELDWLLKDVGRTFGTQLAVSYADIIALDPDEQVQFIIEHMRTTNIIDAETELPHLRRLLKVFKDNLMAVMSYTPRAYPNNVTLMRASERPVAQLQDAQHQDSAIIASQQTASAIEMHVIEGQHFTILKEPHVKALAECLKECIERAQGRVLMTGNPKQIRD
ncbi:MAG: thioesterase domain-containing protein [Blastocatellia bacterium]